MRGVSLDTLPLRFAGLDEYILLAILVLPDTGSCAVHEPVDPQQRQNSFPHNSKNIAMPFVLESQNAAVSNMGKVMNREQIFHGSMHTLQRVAPPLHRNFVKGKFTFIL